MQDSGTSSDLVKVTAYSGKTPYEKWIEMEGIPLIRGYFVEDVRKVRLEPWKRKGGSGVYIQLAGSEQTCDAYICEIPEGSELKPQKHLFEELIYILSGRGATAVWQPGGKKQTFEWSEGSLFSIPLNTHHQHFNARGDKPVRYLGFTSLPPIINRFMDLNFIFENPFVFNSRFKGEEGFFSGKGVLHPGRVWDSNFIPSVDNVTLHHWEERGAGSKNVMFELANSTLSAHISEFQAATYKKAHRHSAGAHVLLLNGHGYSLMWPEGSPWERIDWGPGSLFVPPDQWFHQHFNPGKSPARYLALKPITRKFAPPPPAEVDIKSGGMQIESQDEDPRIRLLFEEERRKSG